MYKRSKKRDLVKSNIINSEDIVNPEDIMNSENIIESDDIIDLDTFNSNKDFISPSKNFGSQWTASEEVTKVSAYKAVLVTNYLYKDILLSEKTEELHILLLRALIYSNISFSFTENLYFNLFLKTLRS
ncbi:27347_t:CDS:2, partial [Gigaspora margarita]